MKKLPGRMGHQAYARLLWLITESPKTAEEVAERMGRGRVSLRVLLWRLEQMGEAHVVAWDRAERERGILSARFAAGPGQSVPYPRPLNRLPPGAPLARSKPRPELIAFVSAIKALREGATRNELHELTGIAPMRVSLMLRELHTLGVIHLSGWQLRADGAGMPSQVFTLGAGRDKRKPPPLTEYQKQRRYRARQQAKRATERVLDALQGKAPILATGVQNYRLGAIA